MYKYNHILYLLVLTLFVKCAEQKTPSKIDRYALVNRHLVENTSIDSLGSLTVGNGTFAFTADITGLQTFPEYYEKGISLGTHSDWGWHSFPNPENYTLDDVVRYYKVGNDSVPYWYQFSLAKNKRQNDATAWLRENPHRLHLGLIGLVLLKDDSTEYKITEIESPVQTLNLWTGELKSKFKVEGVDVEVITFCSQQVDALSFRIKSELIKQNRLGIRLRFPYARHEKFSPGYDLNADDKHNTKIISSNQQGISFNRELDNESYFVQTNWSKEPNIQTVNQHHFIIKPQISEDIFEMTCSFSADNNKTQLPGFKETEDDNKSAWEKFWQSGASVDFSACTDSSAFELERRVVLSQYLTKIQCTGLFPAQETGLTFNSWHGKFHLEMHWWHALHFILWNRSELIEKQLDYYHKIYNNAANTAKFQGYKGVRWPKMVGPEGRESPSNVGTFLIWQQPHIIYMTELLWQNSDNNKEILEKYKDLVFATADFMASYARWDSVTEHYVLGPALIPAQERFAPETTINPAFETTYWYWGLNTAQQWRKRLNLDPDEKWQQVIDKLSPLTIKDDLYLFTQDATDSYTNEVYLTDHPMVLGILGFLPPTDYVDFKTMKSTMQKVEEVWKWETIWGWDTPLAAMDATFLNEPQKAVDFLLMETQKNTYLRNGHNYQHEVLPIYLPGNGGLLSAVALMCTYRNSDGKNGFPDNGKWNVKYENLNHWLK